MSIKTEKNCFECHNHQPAFDKKCTVKNFNKLNRFGLILAASKNNYKTSLFKQTKKIRFSKFIQKLQNSSLGRPTFLNSHLAF